MDIKLALDNQISRKSAQELRLSGFDVVFHARSQPDEIWIEDALTRGATIFVSPDLDIPNYLDRRGAGASWIDVPQGLGGEMQSDFIIRQISRLFRNKLASQPVYKVVELGKYSYLVEATKIEKFLASRSEAQRMQICKWKVKGNNVNIGGDK